MATGLLQGNIGAIIILWLFGIIGIPANIYVIYISLQDNNSKHKSAGRMNKVHNFLITNLAIADILGCIYLVIIAIADSYYASNYAELYSCYFRNACYNCTNIWVKSPTCSLARLLANVSTILPAPITFMISIDRYNKIVKPYTGSPLRLTIFWVKVLVFLSWLVSVSVAIISNIRSERIYDPHNFRSFTNTCYFTDFYDKAFQVFASIGLAMIISFYVITLGLYLLIIIHVRRARRKIISSNSVFENLRKRAETQLSVITGILAITNLLSWLPGLIVYVSNVSYFKFIMSRAGYHFSIIGFLALFINACINPISYTLLISKGFKLSRTNDNIMLTYCCMSLSEN